MILHRISEKLEFRIKSIRIKGIFKSFEQDEIAKICKHHLNAVFIAAIRIVIVYESGDKQCHQSKDDDLIFLCELKCFAYFK